MQISILAAGFTMGEADRLRRLIAAWKRKGGLQQSYDKIVNGMTDRGWDEDFAKSIFEQLSGTGEWQRNRNIRNLIAHRLADLSPLLGRLAASAESRDFRWRTVWTA